MKKIVTLVAAMASLALVVGLIAGPATGAKSTKKQSIADIASGSKQFETLTSLLEQAGLVETLDGKGKFTVFAPTDAAFAKVPQSTLDGAWQRPGAAEGRPALPRRERQADGPEGREALVHQDAERRLGEGARDEEGREGQRRRA